MGSRLLKMPLAVSIKWSLLASVVFLLLILGGLSVMAQWRLTTLAQSIEVMGRDRLPQVRTLGEFELASTRIRLSAVRLALASAEETRRETRVLLDNRIKALDQRIAEHQQAIAGDASAALLFSQFVAKWKSYLALQNRMIDPSVPIDPEQLGQLVNVETFHAFNDVVAAIDAGIKLANLRAEAALNDTESQQATFSIVLLAVNGLSVLIGLATLAFVVREVSMPILRMTESMEAIAKGRLDTEIPFADRGNELGLMARALAVFRKSLIENERLSAATRTLSELSEWLQSAKCESELYGMIADVLARLMPECKGTLYIYAASRDVLEAATHWNGTGHMPSMRPDDCWSLRRGHPYIHGVSEIEFRCHHVHADAAEDYCCIPILAHGETVGLLHLEYSCGETETREDRKARFADRQRLGLACAEHISIAIANVKLRDGLRDQSMRDPLTGLNNRRHFEQEGRLALLRAARAGTPLALLAIDIDHFKAFNDSYGHDAGDLVLRTVGNCMRTVFRGEDIVCRPGGEEFAALIPGADLAGGIARAEELRQTIAALVVHHGALELPRITVSIGVAAYPACGANLDTLVRAADAALYRAKRNGRNRVEPATGGEAGIADGASDGAPPSATAHVAQTAYGQDEAMGLEAA